MTFTYFQGMNYCFSIYTIHTQIFIIFVVTTMFRNVVSGRHQVMLIDTTSIPGLLSITERHSYYSRVNFHFHYYFNISFQFRSTSLLFQRYFFSISDRHYIYFRVSSHFRSASFLFHLRSILFFPFHGFFSFQIGINSISGILSISTRHHFFHFRIYFHFRSTSNLPFNVFSLF